MKRRVGAIRDSEILAEVNRTDTVERVLVGRKQFRRTHHGQLWLLTAVGKGVRFGQRWNLEGELDPQTDPHMTMREVREWWTQLAPRAEAH